MCIRDRLYLLQFTVYPYAHRLEGTGRGMFVLIFDGHRRGDDFRQLFGAGHRLNAITFDDRAGDTFAETLFAKG